MSGDGRRLAAMILEAGKTPLGKEVDVVTGSVLSVTPLKIKVGKLELTKTFLILSPMCQAKTVQIEQDNISTTITLWRGLQIGDDVLMLRCGNGQTYYVLQRKEGATL